MLRTSAYNETFAPPLSAFCQTPRPLHADVFYAQSLDAKLYTSEQQGGSIEDLNGRNQDIRTGVETSHEKPSELLPSTALSVPFTSENSKKMSVDKITREKPSQKADVR